MQDALHNKLTQHNQMTAESLATTQQLHGTIGHQCAWQTFSCLRSSIRERWGGRLPSGKWKCLTCHGVFMVLVCMLFLISTPEKMAQRATRNNQRPTKTQSPVWVRHTHQNSTTTHLILYERGISLLIKVYALKSEYLIFFLFEPAKDSFLI